MLLDGLEYLQAIPVTVPAEFKKVIQQCRYEIGRRIAISRILSFDTLEYRGLGNEVHCRVLTG